MKLRVVLALTVMASSRAMTLAYIARAGDGGPGDPPEAWLMPLIGDAAVGLTALVVAVLIWRVRTAASWVVAVVWSAIGAFDALAAFIVETSAPWPDFFMLEIFGRTMFFMAAGMQVLIIYLLSRPDVVADFGITQADRSSPGKPRLV